MSTIIDSDNFIKLGCLGHLLFMITCHGGRQNPRHSSDKKQNKDVYMPDTPIRFEPYGLGKEWYYLGEDKEMVM